MSKKRSKVLAAGPWLGEFGHELFSWQSFLRAKAKDYDKIIISSRLGNELLYRDFCTKFIPCEGDINACSAAKSYSDDVPDVFRKVKYNKLITPRRMGGEQKFIKYGGWDPDLSYDIVMHARHVVIHKKWTRAHAVDKMSRNWDGNKWNKLAKELREAKYRCCSVGLSSAAYRVKGTDNRLDLPLEKLANVMASSRLVIGPSSGPMHFASLCGTPHLVWTRVKNRRRYKEWWNPFDTPVYLYIDETWNPKVSAIYDMIRGILPR